jgi:hypothetical protein
LLRSLRFCLLGFKGFLMDVSSFQGLQNGVGEARGNDEQAVRAAVKTHAGFGKGFFGVLPGNQKTAVVALSDALFRTLGLLWRLGGHRSRPCVRRRFFLRGGFLEGGIDVGDVGQLTLGRQFGMRNA